MKTNTELKYFIKFISCILKIKLSEIMRQNQINAFNFNKKK